MAENPQIEPNVMTDLPQIKNSEEDDPLLGQTIAQRFRLEEKIGEGAWSVVYRAWHTRLEKFVAVKILLPHLLSNTDKLGRFQQEAEAASHLRHKNIVTIFDFGMLNDGRPFLAMDLVEGESLAARLERVGKLSADECAAIAAQVADALTAAHTGGMIHRDIKPANIMLEKNAAGDDCVRLADFGIVKIIEPTSLKPEFTQTGDIVGTPSYMSPEQCLGQALDGRSDVYSLACVMYECLAGKRAFDGRNTFDCMRRHISSAPPQIFSENAAGDQRQLERLIAVCMSKSSEERPTAAHLSQLLEKSLNGTLDVSKDLAALNPHGGKGVPRLLLLTAAAAVLAFALLLGLFMFKPASDVPPPKPTAEQAEQAATPATPQSYFPAYILEKLTFTQILNQNFAEIQSAINALKPKDPAKAAALQGRLNEFIEKSKDGSWTFSQPGEALHVVATEGVPVAPRDARNTIKLTVSNKLKSPTILVLAAQSPTIWDFSGSSFAQLKKIYFISSRTQTAKGVAKNIPIERKNDWIQGSMGNPYDTSILRANDLAQKLTGHSITTIIPHDTPARTSSSITVGPENEQWRAQVLLAQMRPLYNEATAAARFEFGQWLNANDLRVNIPYKFSGGTPVGVLKAPTAPGETFIPGPYQRLPQQPPDTQAQIKKTQFSLENSLRPKVLSVEGRDYSIGGRGPVLLDGDGRTKEQLEPPDTIRYSPNDNDFTYDSKRSRFLVKDSGTLYEVDPRSKKWRGIDNLNSWEERNGPFQVAPQIEGMCYKPEDDCLYFLDFGNTNSERATALVKYSVEGGKPLARIPLSLPLPIESNGGNAFTAMYYVKPYFVVISSAPLELYADRRPYIYIVDPAKGKVLYNAPIQVEPAGGETSGDVQ